MIRFVKWSIPNEHLSIGDMMKYLPNKINISNNLFLIVNHLSHLPKELYAKMIYLLCKRVTFTCFLDYAWKFFSNPVQLKLNPMSIFNNMNDAVDYLSGFKRQYDFPMYDSNGTQHKIYDYNAHQNYIKYNKMICIKELSVHHRIDSSTITFSVHRGCEGLLGLWISKTHDISKIDHIKMNIGGQDIERNFDLSDPIMCFDDGYVYNIKSFVALPLVSLVYHGVDIIIHIKPEYECDIDNIKTWFYQFGFILSAITRRDMTKIAYLMHDSNDNNAYAIMSGMGGYISEIKNKYVPTSFKRIVYDAIG